MDCGNDLRLSPELRDGPKRNRHCTDIACCMAFAVFLCFSWFITVDSLFKGDMSKIARPYDSDGTLVLS